MIAKPLNAFVVLALFAGWLVGFGSVVWSASHHSSQIPKSQSQQIDVAEQKREGSKPSRADSANGGQATQNKEEKSEFWSAKLTDWLLAIFTLFLVVCTYRLWKSTDKLWAAGEKQLLHLENAAELRLRAYIFVEWARLECEQGTESWAIHVSVKNAGQTPAYNVTIKTDREISSAKPDDIILALSDNADSHPKSSIGPGASAVLRLPCNWEFCVMGPGVQGWNQAARNKERAYVWGRIDYISFEKPHWVTFQMQCAFDSQVNSFGLCANGNDSDEQRKTAP